MLDCLGGKRKKITNQSGAGALDLSAGCYRGGRVVVVAVVEGGSKSEEADGASLPGQLTLPSK